MVGRFVAPANIEKTSSGDGKDGEDTLNLSDEEKKERKKEERGKREEVIRVWVGVQSVPGVFGVLDDRGDVCHTLSTIDASRTNSHRFDMTNHHRDNSTDGPSEPREYTRQWAAELVATLDLDVVDRLLDGYTALASDPALSTEERKLGQNRADALILAAITTELTSLDSADIMPFVDDPSSEMEGQLP